MEKNNKLTFVHTFYSEPLFKKKFYSIKDALGIILWNYAYSLSCVKKYGYKIKLYTDEVGKEILSFLPYDDIIVLTDYKSSEHFAASFKFYALEKCELGDILIDGDCFLVNKEMFDFILNNDKDVLYSFYEINDNILDLFGKENRERQEKYYSNMLNILELKKDEIKYELPKLYTLEYPNTSFLQIKNQELKDEYIKQYFYHKDLFIDSDFGETWPDIIFEQYFLKKIIEKHNYTKRAIISKYPEGSEEDRKLGFIHLGAEKPKLLENVKECELEIDRNLYFKTNLKYCELLVKLSNNMLNK
jgi:hypothetical protein